MLLGQRSAAVEPSLIFLSQIKINGVIYQRRTLNFRQKLRKPLFSFENSGFYWSEWRDSNSRHPGPKGRRNIFSDSSRPFPMLSAPKPRALRTSCLHRFQVLRTGLWSDMWSNTASRLVAAIPATNREAFSSST